MYPRTLSHQIQIISQHFPVLMLTGPRQVGKTTLLELCAQTEAQNETGQTGNGDERGAQSSRNYVTLDDLDARSLAQNDPALFLQTWPAPVIIDEIQYAPQLFSAIKIQVDRSQCNGQFWLTGSQRFHLMRGIGESLAGRVAIVDLLGLSLSEIQGRAESNPFLPSQEWLAARQSSPALGLQPLYQQIWLGSYPRLNQQGPQMRDLFYRSYMQTYIQRDISEILNISDHIRFHRFMASVAARTGQLLNYASLARDSDIDNKTAKAWLSLLETSGLVYLLQPYHSNLSKRLLKTPKLYFLDTGLASYLTRWPDATSLERGSLSGAILETWAIGEILKSYWHNAKEAPLYFYRDTNQQEIDLLIEGPDCLYPVEIKKTASPSHNAKKHFPVLNKLEKAPGPGGVLCLVERPLPLSRDVMAIPFGML